MFVGSTYCNVPTSKSKNIIPGLKIKTVDCNKRSYLGHPTSCLDSHTAVVQYVTQLAQLDCSMWWHESTTFIAKYLVHSSTCWHCKLREKYETSLQLARPIFTQTYDNTPFIIPLFIKYLQYVFSAVFHYIVTSPLISWWIRKNFVLFLSTYSITSLWADRHASLNDEDTFWEMHH
jgi:hypothetical protein